MIKRSATPYVALLIAAAVHSALTGCQQPAKAHNEDAPETLTEKLVDAAGAGQIDAASALIKGGIKVSDGAEGSVAPLFAAVCSGKSDSVKLLISKGANVNQRYVVTPAETVRIKRAKYKGAWDVLSGDTPLLACARAGNIDLAKLLLADGADVKAANDNKSTAVSLAMQPAISIDLMKLLVQHGASVAVTDSNGDSPLMWVLQRNDGPFALAVLKAGSNVDNINHFNETALLQAARANMFPDIEVRLARVSKDLDLADSKGYCSLSFASSYNRTELVKALIDKGANLNPSDPDGSTPLITAVFLGEAQIVQLLVAAHADLKPKDKNDYTALDWAKSKHNREIISILENAAKTASR